MTRLLWNQAQPSRCLVLGTLGCALALVSLLAARSAPADTPAKLTCETRVDEALGKKARQEFAAALAEKSYGGKKHEWKAYADWGRQLLTKGSVNASPEGDAPSKPLSSAYRCVHCHNLGREDAKLTNQDPEVRETLIRTNLPADPSKRDGNVLSLTPGSTLWGAVNRENFYNGYYAKYRDLKVASGKPTDPNKLSDAVEICCCFCSVGRYPKAWELDSILAALWELELRMKDLDLPESDLRKLFSDLQSDQVITAANARVAIKNAHLRAAAATRSELPSRTTIEFDEYAPGQIVTGEAKAGKLLYESACAGCHNKELDLPDGRSLGSRPKRFHEYVWQGTEHNDALYMPFFTKERLSQRQAADIRAYLRSLPNP